MKKMFILLILVLSSMTFAQNQVLNEDLNFRGSKLFPQVLYDSVGNKYYYSTDLQSSGFYGATLITTTTVVVGKFHAIQVLEDAVIDSLVSTKLTGDAHALALPAGTTLLCSNITRIKLTSGKVWAYKSE